MFRIFGSDFQFLVKELFFGKNCQNFTKSKFNRFPWLQDRDYEADSADYPFDEQRTEYQKGIGSSPSPRHSERYESSFFLQLFSVSGPDGL